MGTDESSCARALSCPQHRPSLFINGCCLLEALKQQQRFVFVLACPTIPQFPTDPIINCYSIQRRTFLTADRNELDLLGDLLAAKDTTIRGMSKKIVQSFGNCLRSNCSDKTRFGSGVGELSTQAIWEMAAFSGIWFSGGKPLNWFNR